MTYTKDTGFVAEWSDPANMDYDIDDDPDPPVGFGVPPMFTRDSTGMAPPMLTRDSWITAEHSISEQGNGAAFRDNKLHCDFVPDTPTTPRFQFHPFFPLDPDNKAQSDQTDDLQKFPMVRSDRGELQEHYETGRFAAAADPYMFVSHEVSVESSYGSLPSAECETLHGMASMRISSENTEEQTLLPQLESLPITNDFSKLNLYQNQEAPHPIGQQIETETAISIQDNAQSHGEYQEEDPKPFYIGRRQSYQCEDSGLASGTSYTNNKNGDCEDYPPMPAMRNNTEMITVTLKYPQQSVHRNVSSYTESENRGCLFDEITSREEVTPEMTCRQDSDGDTLLHIAIIQYEVSFVYFILNAVPCHTVLDITNHLQQTVLHIAVLTHQPNVVRKLVARGARIDTRDKNGNTALHLACKLGCLECARQLTVPVQHSEIGSCLYRVPFQRIPQDPNMLNYEGQACVHLAADSGNKNLLVLLLSHHVGHDVNIPNGLTGRTVLHHVVQRRNLDMITFLVQHRMEYKLDLNARAFDGLTPLQAAQDTKNMDVALLLSMVGAKIDCENKDAQ